MRMFPSEFLEFASVFEEVWDDLLGETLFDTEHGDGVISVVENNHQYLETNFELSNITIESGSAQTERERRNISVLES